MSTGLWPTDERACGSTSKTHEPPPQGERLALIGVARRAVDDANEGLFYKEIHEGMVSIFDFDDDEADTKIGQMFDAADKNHTPRRACTWAAGSSTATVPCSADCVTQIQVIWV